VLDVDMLDTNASKDVDNNTEECQKETEENEITSEEEEEKTEEFGILETIKEKEKEKVGNDGDSVATTKADNINRTRMGLMITLPPSKELDKRLTLELQKWFNKMKEVDKKFTVISWKKEDGPMQPIREAKHIPNVISKLRVYFSRIQARSSGGKIFTDVFVQHTIPINDLRGDTEWFLKENHMAMFEKQLQVESTTQIGWLLYSTPSLDNESLVVAIETEIGVQVALRWKYINSSKYIEDEMERKKWMAIHLEVDSKKEKKARRGINRLYGSQSSKFPLGIRMRLVSEFREVRDNSVMMGKHTRLRVRQASFISLIEGNPSDDILMLDYNDGGLILRNLIMSIESRNPETPGNLFRAVGKDWKGRIIFNFLKNKADEARMIVDGLIPYLQYHHGEKIHSFFDPEAVIDKEKWTWNEETGTMITPLSEELDGLEAIDDDYDFTVTETQSSRNEENDETLNNNNMNTNNTSSQRESAEDAALARLNLVMTGADTDSVSTLGNPSTPANIRRDRVSNMIAIRTAQSGTSSVTDSSLDSRMSAIEQRINSMETSITNSLEASMARLLERMNPPSLSLPMTQPPGGEIAGREDE
jgi:hypothetical protein